MNSPRLPQFLFAAATLVAASSAFAATITKETTGSDLTAAASWNPSSAVPGAADVATWTATSLGGAVTMATAQSWLGINVSGATANIVETGAGVLTLGTSGVTLTGTKTLDFSSAVVISGNQTWAIADVTNNSNRDAIFRGAVTGSGNLTKTGAGTLSFESGASLSAFTGKISVTGGVLSYVGGGTLGNNPGAFVADGLTLDGGTLGNVGGSIQSYNIAANRGVTLGAGGGTFNASGTFAITVNSVITGSGALTNSGGILILNGVNTYAGGTTVGGTLAINSGAALGSGGLTLNNGSTLASTGTGAVTVTNTLTLQSGAVNTFTFGDTTNTGKVTLTSGTALGGYEKKFSVAAGSSAELSGILTGTLPGGSNALTKQGSGTLILSGANTYTGITTVNAGTLVAGSALALGVGATSVNVGTLQIASGVTLTQSALLTVASGAILKFTDATSQIAVSNGYTLNGTAIIDLNGGFAGSLNQTYNLITGTGTKLDGSVVVQNGAAGYTYGFSQGVLTVTAVPEPSVYGLTGAGVLVALAAVRRRRARAGKV